MCKIHLLQLKLRSISMHIFFSQEETSQLLINLAWKFSYGSG